MTEKYRIFSEFKYDYTLIGEYIDEKHTDKPLRYDEVVNLLNKQDKEIQELKQRNQRQYERLKEITDLMFKREWKTLENIVEDWEMAEELLQAEHGNYGDYE